MTYPEVCYSKIESNAANKNLAGPAKEEAVGEEFQTVTNAGDIYCEHSGGYKSVLVVWGYKTSTFKSGGKVIMS